MRGYHPNDRPGAHARGPTRELAAALACCAVLVAITHLAYATEGRDRDDQAHYRAAAWMSAYPDDPSLAQARVHLALHEQQLGHYRHQRFWFRLVLRDYCVVQNACVRWLERLPLGSPDQSVRIAGLALHLAAIALSFAAIAFVHGEDAPRFAWTYLLACVPFLGFWPIKVGELLPFVASATPWIDHGWTVPPPRGAALVYFAAAVFCAAGDSPGRVASRRAVVAALFAASVLAHAGVAISSAVVAIVLAGFWRLSPALEPHRAHARWGALRWGLALNLVLVAIALTKLAYLWAAGCRELHPAYPTSLDSPHGLVRNVVRLISWTVLYEALALAWLARARRAAPPTGEQWLFRLFLAWGGCAIGLNVVHPGLDAWYTDLMYVTEACRRLNGVAVLLAAALGLALARGTRAAQLASRGGLRAAFALALVAAFVVQAARAADLTRPTGDPSELTPTISALVAEPGLSAYDDEARYFHAIANELRARHAGAGAPR